MTLDKVNELINEYKDILPEMLANNQIRWAGYYGSNKLETIANVKNRFINKELPQIKKFFENRAKYALEDMEEYLNK